MQLATYAYVNAKTRALLSSLLDSRTWDRLTDAPDLAAAVEIIKTTAYRARWEEAGADGTDPETVERVLSADLRSAYEKIRKSFRTRTEQDLLSLLMEKASLDELKTALRLWRRRTPDEIERYLPQRSDLGIDYRAVTAASTFDDVIDILKKTPYREPLQKARDRFVENNSLFDVETALDIDYYQRLLACVNRLSRPDRKTARAILGLEIDIENIRRLIRERKYYSLGLGAMLESIIPGGLRVNKESVREFYTPDGLPRVVDSVALGPYAKIKSLVDEDVSALEGFLRNLLTAQVRKTLAGLPFTIGTVLGYLILKEQEIRNLTAVFYAKYCNLKRDKLAALIA